MKSFGKQLPEDVLKNLRYCIEELKRSEVWVRHDLRTQAEQVMQALQEKGAITSFEYREECSTRGSANYQIQYP